MKIFLDDERDTPEGWVRAYWPAEVIELLRGGEVDEISLDHDLGDDMRGTGYDVLLWLEEVVFNNPDFKVPTIHLHTANSSAMEKMNRAIKKINSMIR